MKCSECGSPIGTEQDGGTYFATGDTGPDDEALCYGCYEAVGCEFECCLCCDFEHEAYQDRVGDYLIVAEPVPLDVLPARNIKPGVYEIVKHPYYGGPLIGAGYFFDGTLRRCGDLPGKTYMNGFPSGHCCRSCAGAMKPTGATR